MSSRHKRTLDYDPMDVHLSLAQEHMRRGQLDQAEAEFEKAQKKSPDDVRVELGLRALARARQSERPPSMSEAPSEALKDSEALEDSAAHGGEGEGVRRDSGAMMSRASAQVIGLVKNKRYEEALEILHAARDNDPTDAEVLRSIKHLEAHLERRYLKRIGGLRQVPTLLSSAPLQDATHRDARSLSALIDGATSFEEILERVQADKKLTRYRALKALAELVDGGHLTLHPPSKRAPSKPRLELVELEELEKAASEREFEGEEAEPARDPLLEFSLRPTEMPEEDSLIPPARASHPAGEHLAASHPLLGRSGEVPRARLDASAADATEGAEPPRASAPSLTISAPAPPKRGATRWAVGAGLLLILIIAAAGVYSAFGGQGAPAPHEFMITSTPPGASVSLGTQVLGQTPLRTVLTEAQLRQEEESLTFEFTREGSEPTRVEHRLREGTNVVDVRLPSADVDTAPH